MNHLAGKRILVIEDEYFIASDLKRALARQAAEVIGPTGDLDTGLALVADEPLDAAILDVNLEGAMSFPIADELAGRSVPFVFLTGYDDWALPQDYRHVPRVAKPYTTTIVLRAVEQLLAA